MTVAASLPTEATRVRGPFFDELVVGATFDDAPAVTLSDGMRAVHRSIAGNRLRLALDDSLSSEVTGQAGTVSPALVWDVSIGQSTSVTQHVKANLFYRGLAFRRHPVLGDTLRTITTIDALKQNKARPGRSATGLAVLHIVTTDQHDRPVLDYWRCAMLPLSDAGAPDGPSDDLDAVGTTPTSADYVAAVRDWDLTRYRERVPGEHFDSLGVGRTWIVEGADVVSSAPELARLTGNLAKVHHDAEAAGGTRLVYGGHTIGLAFHQVTRALPAMVTVGGWQGCDHLGPVREGDALTSMVVVQGLDRFDGGGGVAHLRVEVEAAGRDGSTSPVLDWAVSVVMA